jgi:hypothetical protein
MLPATQAVPACIDSEWLHVPRHQLCRDGLLPLRLQGTDALAQSRCTGKDGAIRQVRGQLARAAQWSDDSLGVRPAADQEDDAASDEAVVVGKRARARQGSRPRRVVIDDDMDEANGEVEEEQGQQQEVHGEREVATVNGVTAAELALTGSQEDDLPVARLAKVLEARKADASHCQLAAPGAPACGACFVFCCALPYHAPFEHLRCITSVEQAAHADKSARSKTKAQGGPDGAQAPAAGRVHKRQKKAAGNGRERAVASHCLWSENCPSRSLSRF